MQIRHTYREFSLENRVFKGEAWVNSQGETTQFAKEYADKNPAELKADVEALKKAVQEQTADALDLEKLRIVEGVGKIVQEGKHFPTDQVNGTYVLTQNEASQGLIALIKAKFPEYLAGTAITQLAYKWMIGQNSGVNFVKTGDKVTFDKGFLSVERDGAQVMTHIEILPINVLLGENTESPAPTEPKPVEPAPTEEAPNPTATTENAPGEKPTIEPQPAAPAESEALSERDAALQKAWEIEKQVLIQAAIDGGVTLDIKDEGPHGNNKDITVFKDGEPVGHIELQVPLGKITAYDRDNNVNVFTRAKGRREISQDPEAGLRMILEANQPKVAEEKPQKEEEQSKHKQALEAALAVESDSLKITDPEATLKEEGPNHWSITTLNGTIDIKIPPFGVVEDLNSDPENNVSIIGKKTEGKPERFRTIGEALDHLRQGEPQKEAENEEQDSVGLDVAKVALDRKMKEDFAVNGEPATYTAEQHGRNTKIQIVRADGRKAEIDIQRTRGGKFKAEIEQFTNDNGFEISLQVDGQPKQRDLKDLGEVFDKVKKGFEAPLIKTTEAPIETPSFEKALRIFDLEKAKTSEGVLLQDAPLGQILGEGVNPQVVGRLGKYPLTVYTKTAEGIYGGISLEDLYVTVLIKKDGSAQMEIHAQDEVDKAGGTYDRDTLASASVTSSADARNFLEDFQDQIEKNLEEASPSSKEKREQKEAEKAEIEALEASLKEPYIEALRRLAAKHPEITKFKVDEQLTRLTPQFSIKKDKENPALCTVTLGFMYRDAWVGAEQTYRYSDLKDNVEEAAKAFAVDTLGGLEAATPEQK